MDLELSFGGHNQELDFGGYRCLFHMKSFLILLSAIGIMAIWGPWPPVPPLEGRTLIRYLRVSLNVSG